MDNQDLNKHGIKHLAFIMDGNRRWAVKHNKALTIGHQKGIEKLKEIVLECKKLAIKYLTVFAFSSENWKRSEGQVNGLMSLMRKYLNNRYFEELNENQIVVRIIGRIDELPTDVRDKIDIFVDKQDKQIKEAKLELYIALNYGAQNEIIDACKNIIDDAGSKKINKSDIKKEVFERYLYSQIPPPDLLIRTGNVMRISNFLLWQIAYSELYFSDKFWPEFSIEDLYIALEDFRQRERRYGN